MIFPFLDDFNELFLSKVEYKFFFNGTRRYVLGQQKTGHNLCFDGNKVLAFLETFIEKKYTCFYKIISQKSS